MARNGMISRRRKSQKIDDFDLSPIVEDADEIVVHVLAVDDSLIDRKVIEQLLKISSCKVTAVDSGRRALQFLGLDDEKTSAGFDGLKVDLIITDYCMPGMTGYELLKKIKESSTFKEIPVVIMSSENVLARIDRCLEEGAEDFIVKPVKLSDVKRLKDYTMTRDVTPGTNQGRCINKRKSRETSELLSSVSSLSSPPTTISSPPTTISSPPTTISSPPTTISSQPTTISSQPTTISSAPTTISSQPTTISSAPTTISSPTSLPPISLSSLSEQSLHTSLDSPTRRIKMTGCV